MLWTGSSPQTFGKEDLTMPEIQSILISASAGSGKTYQLSTRYLSLLALNGADPSLGASSEHLIALTFTRKAAAEFRSRILSDLAKGASDEIGAEKLRRRILDALEDTTERPGIAPGSAAMMGPLLTREFFLRRLREVMDNYSRLALETIDGLFSRLARSASLDLGYSGMNIIDQTEEETEKRRALLKVYQEWAKDPAVMKRMEGVFSESFRGEKSNARAEEIMFDLVKRFHELYLDCPDKESWGNPKSLKLTKSEITPSATLEEIAETARDLLDNLPDEIMIRSATSSTYTNKRDLYEKFLEGIADFPKKHYFDCDTKTLDFIFGEVIPEPSSDEIHTEVQILGRMLIPYELEATCNRTQAAYELIQEFDRRYFEHVRSRGRFCFHDITRLLGEIDSDLLFSLMSERIDVRYNHWLLDEFQDTSRNQWKVLEPFLREVVQDESGKRSLFVVGDEKQSIYQWRGGDVTLFRSLSNETPWKEKLKQMQLSQSFRSAPPVLNLVNDLCDFSKTAPEAAPSALEEWQFPKHISANANLSGCAQILQTTETDEGKDGSMLQILCDLLLKIKPWMRQENGRPLTCAILVSTKKGAIVAKNFILDAARRAKIEIPIQICDDIDIGIDSPIGKGLFHFFRYLQMPGNEAARNSLAALPFAPLLDTPWEQWRKIFDTGGYSCILRTIENVMANVPEWKNMSPFLRERLHIWQEEAAKQDVVGMPLHRWISHMEEMTRREEPSPSSIQIMTIHKAKGLGFDIVFLPVFSTTTTFSSLNYLKIRRTENGEVKGLLNDVPSLLYKHMPALKKLTDAWVARQDSEGFCKTYVAVTRSVRATYILLPPAPKKIQKVGTSMKSIFSDTKSNHTGKVSKAYIYANAYIKYSSGHPEWYQSIPVANTSAPAPSKPSQPHFNVPIRPTRRQPSENKGFLPLSAESSARIKAMADLGTAVHAVLSSWETLPPAFPDNLDPHVANALRSIWKNSEAVALLTPQTGDLVYREQSLEALNPDNGEWTSAVIDRLVLHANGTATIVDYKTSRSSPAEELVVQYAPQLNTYARLVSQACRIPRNRIRCVILATATGEVIEVRSKASSATL